MRVGILASHPIQYQAPWFRGLAKVADVTVFFAHRQSAVEQGQAGFGVAFNWDVDLVSGYRHAFLQNVSASPSVDEFAGCDTPEIAEIIRREKFDAFIVNGWYLKSFLQAARACRRFSTPVLIRGDSQLYTPRRWLKRFAKTITHTVLLRYFDGFLYVGKRNAEYLRRYGADKNRMFFVPHFVDNDWFAAKALDALRTRQKLRNSWSANDNSILALFVGKFISEKRPQDLIKAIRAARDRGLDIQVVFVGSGELETSLRDIGAQLKVPLCFEGFRNQSELPAFYAAADVLVLPSESETWGLVVNEAMACGRPAIVSEAVGCAPDLIDEGETGYVFPLGDISALRERLQTIAQKTAADHNWRPALSAKLRTFSLEKAVEGTIGAIQTLMKKQRRFPNP